jgi:hypothetical protein
VREETGLTPRVIQRVGRYSLTSGLEAQVFLCEVDTEASLTGEDDLHVGWYAPNAIPQPVRNSLHYALPDVLAGRRNVQRTELAPIT